MSKGNQNYQLLEQREPKMLASIWPSRDKSHGTKLHNSQFSMINYYVSMSNSVLFSGHH